MTDNIRLAFQGIWGHKLRSLLTMLGIIIGIAAIITIVSTIKGTNEQIKQNLIGSGNNVVTVQLYQSDYVYDMQYSSLPTGVRPIAETQRAELEDLPGVDKVSFYLARTNLMDTVFFRDTAFSGKVYGIDRAYFQVAGYRLAQGRGFLDSDYENSRKVVIVDRKAVQSLFVDEDPVGQTLEIGDEAGLMPCIIELAQAKRAYERLRGALEQVEATGYGIVMPTIGELQLEQPEIVQQGGRYGVRLQASAPSLHIMRAVIRTELNPIVGSERQSRELAESLLASFADDPVKLWESNLFGKSLHQLVNEGLQAKLLHMPQEARTKMQETLERVINEGCTGLICILL